MNSYFVAVLPLVGVIVGGILSYIFQFQLNNKQFQIENGRYLRDRLIDRLRLYSQVLKVDGELRIVELSGGIKKTFNLNDYLNKIRPILYNDFYLVDEEIRTSIYQLDNHIAGGRFFEDIDSDTEDFLATVYFDIIDQIKVKFDFYQKNIIFDK